MNQLINQNTLAVVKNNLEDGRPHAVAWRWFVQTRSHDFQSVITSTLPNLRSTQQWLEAIRDLKHPPRSVLPPGQQNEPNNRSLSFSPPLRKMSPKNSRIRN